MLLLLFACASPDGSVSDEPGLDSAEVALPALALVEPRDGFLVAEGSVLHARAAVPAGEAVLRWTVNDAPVPTCPSAEDALACELSGLAQGEVHLCVEADGYTPACVDGTVHRCVGSSWYVDADGDGYGAGPRVLAGCEAPAGAVRIDGDCDDGDAAAHPGAAETCNDRDDDCDGFADDAPDAPAWFRDSDGDGFGDGAIVTRACVAPAGSVADATDCDDADATVSPHAMELCNARDDDCDGEVDEDDAVDAPPWYLDADGDGWGLTTDAARACALPEGRAADPADCDDAQATVHPDAVELCNGVDDDCEGGADEPDALDALTWYADADADGFGDPAAPSLGCTAPTGTVADATDCDDASADVAPDAAELCDGVDDDCDGVVDEPDAIDAPTWYGDSDGDGFGDAGATAVGCEAPEAYVAATADCDDTDATAWPGADERLDGVDDDCDGLVDDLSGLWETDLVANGDFELGDLTGWSHESGPCEIVTALAWTSPYEGTYLLSGGSPATGDCLVTQSFDLLSLGFYAEDLDSGLAGVDVAGWLANEVDTEWWNWNTTFDRSILHVRYFDADSVELGSMRTLLSESETWTERSASGLLPEGTRTLVLELEARLRAGARINSAADAVSMSVTMESPSSPTLTRLPLLQDHRQDAMRLLWETDGNLCAHVVEWAPSGEALSNTVTAVDTVEIDPDHYVHVATIEGLEGGTAYDYRVGSGDTWSDTYTFRTAPLDGEPFAIGWVGDNQQGTDVFAAHLRAMLARGADLFISPGDIVNDVDMSGVGVDVWEDEWFGPLESTGFGATQPVLFARGNHDNHRSLAYAYSALPENEDWYTFSYGNVFVVVLDSNSVSDSHVTALDQAQYLEDALTSDAAILADFRVVTFHNPPYTNSRHDDLQDGFSGAREDWVPLFETYGVDLVIGGHYHAYQRGAQNGVTYLVVGGGGGNLDDREVENYPFFSVVDQVNSYGLMEVDGTTLSWTAFDRHDTPIDTLTLTAREHL